MDITNKLSIVAIKQKVLKIAVSVQTQNEKNYDKSKILEDLKEVIRDIDTLELEQSNKIRKNTVSYTKEQEERYREIGKKLAKATELNEFKEYLLEVIKVLRLQFPSDK